MELLAGTKIDFMRYRRVFVPLSALLMLASVALLLTGSLNVGIDFAGGTQLIVQFREQPEIDVLRDLLTIGQDPPVIQQFGRAEDNEVIIKTRLSEGEEEGSRSRVVERLEERFNGGGGALDLNLQGTSSLAGFLLERDPDDMRSLGEETVQAHYDQIAADVMEVRRANGLIRDWSEIDAIGGVSEDVMSALRAEARLGVFAVLSAENVGPQIGAELRNRGILAIVFSLVGMLAYIWIRFELRFGIGALVAVVHDVIIAVGVYVVLGYEFNLTTIAAFLTLVGYSVNDSVVIFDRVRENLRRGRREPLIEVLNKSLNQTLSRTLMTSGTTFFALVTMYLFGGDVLRGFSFVLLIGVAIGTYSSVFVASPTVLAWDRLRGRA